MADSDDVERTDDGRYLIIGGRRWRAGNPAIPDTLRTELVSELMASRRAVKSQGDAARHRVRDAKIALGERGEPWWDEPTAAGRRERIDATIRTLLRHREEDKTICPSDVARTIGGEQWRAAMDAVRAAAAELASAKVVRVTQKGEDVDLATVTGPVRIGRGERWT